jgi:HPt (histidine-containing phosphotransfer) domain-containing protein
MIDSYSEDASALLATIREATDRRDAIVLRRAVHALRSPSASLGAVALASICADVEKDLRYAADVAVWPPAGIDALLTEAERAMVCLQARDPRRG